MLNSIRKMIPVLLLMAAPAFALQAPEPVVMVPLLPSDDGNNVKFTKESFQQLLDSQKDAAKGKAPTLPVLTVPPANVGFNTYIAFAQAVTFLLDNASITGSGDYLEGAPPSGYQITEGWPYQYFIGTQIARSTYGLIGGALLSSLKHAPDLEPFSITDPVQAVYAMAQVLAADYAGNGPLAATKAPFMGDIIFLAKFEDSGLKPASDATNYKTIATSWFNRIKDLSAPGDGSRTAANEVDRIFAARDAQGLAELTGYDVGLLIMAAKALGDNTYATAAATALAGKSWEVIPTLLAADADIRSSTGNMLSRGALMAANPTTYNYATFFAGSQLLGEGVSNLYESYGYFLPSGSIESNSWIIAALAMSGDGTGANWAVAKKGCQYLLETLQPGGNWYSYPLFPINNIYPQENAAALLALSSTAYLLEIDGIKDRENTDSLSGVHVKVKNTAGDSIMVKSDSGKAYVGGILDAGTLDIEFFVDNNLANELRGLIIGSFDASIVLEEALKTPPFGTDPGTLYGVSSYAVMASDLERAGIVAADVNVQIASEILAFAVGNPPIVFTGSDFTFALTTNIASSTITAQYGYISGFVTTSPVRLVLIGDISNNFPTDYVSFTPPFLAGAAPANPPLSPMRLTLSGFIRQEGKILLPVVLSRVAEAPSGAQAFQFEVTYDAQALTYTGLRSGEIAKDFMYADNGRQTGVVIIAMASGRALTRDGTIAWLEFSANSGAALLPESFGLRKMLINELAVVSESGNSVLETTTINSTAGESSLPGAFSLEQNNPNPFNPSTSISYNIPAAGEPLKVRLTVFNLRGQTVRTLVDGQRPAGSYTVHWDGLDRQGQAVPSGVYFYRLETGTYTKTRKMVILK